MNAMRIACLAAALAACGLATAATSSKTQPATACDAKLLAGERCPACCTNNCKDCSKCKEEKKSS